MVNGRELFYYYYLPGGEIKAERRTCSKSPGISSSRSDGCPYSGPLRPGPGHCPAALLLHSQDTGTWCGGVCVCVCVGVCSHCTLPRAPTDRGWPFIPPLPCDLRLPPSPQLWEAQRCARETGVRSYLQEAAPQPPPSRPPPRLALLLSLAWGWDIPGPCLRLHGGGGPGKNSAPSNSLPPPHSAPHPAPHL